VLVGVAVEAGGETAPGCGSGWSIQSLAWLLSR
jgi:hypothetical protein